MVGDLPASRRRLTQSATSDDLSRTMSRSIRYFAAALCLLTLFACQDSATPKVGSNGMGASRAWTVDSELTQRYGKLPGPGKGVREDNLDARVDVCLRQEFVDQGIPSTWVAVCGNVLQASHSQGGWVDLLVFTGARDSAKVVSESSGWESGTFGEPGEVSLVRIGRARRAFVLSSVYTGLGDMIESETWYSPDSAKLREVLSSQVYFSNEGQLPCDEDSIGCRWERRRLGIDSSDGLAETFPIAMEDSARLIGAFQTRKERILFQRDSGRYFLPEALLPNF